MLSELDTTWLGIYGKTLEQILKHKGYEQIGTASVDGLGIHLNRTGSMPETTTYLIDEHKFNTAVHWGITYRIYSKREDKK